MKSLQQRSDGLVSAHEPQALDRPVARRLIGVLEVSDQDFSHPLRINPAISQEPERPKRPVPLGLNFRFGLVYEKLNVRRIFCQVHGGQVDFDGSRSHAEVVGIQGRGDERIQLRTELELSSPVAHSCGDLVVRAIVVVDRPF